MIINIDGNYRLVTHKTNNIVAKIYSMSLTDINFGVSSDQTAKLLSLCAPGKNYRYPISGVGITDYINSVVINSDLSEKLMKEFENNNTPISSAEFDSATGDLKISQSKDLEEEISGTIDDLDLNIIFNADDDFIRKNLKDLTPVSTEEVLKNFGELENIYGIFFLGDAKIELVSDGKTVNDKTFSFYHEQNDKSYFKGYYSPNKVVLSGVLYPGDLIWLKGFQWSALAHDNSTGESYEVNTPFVLTESDQEFDGALIQDKSLYSKVSVQAFDTRYDECGIILRKCKVFYTVDARDLDSKTYGVFRINVDEETAKDMLCLVHDNITGRLLAQVSADSNIKDISLDQQKGRLLIQ